MSICLAKTKKGFPCNYKCNISGYCGIHYKINKYEKPEECAICFESLEKTKTPLKCGHWIHINCIKKCEKLICPICRCVLTTIKRNPKSIKFCLMEKYLTQELRQNISQYMNENYNVNIVFMNEIEIA